MIVPQRTVLREDAMTLRLVDRRGRTVQEGTGALMVFHQGRQSAAVGRQVTVPVVGLGNGEIQDVLGVGRQAGHITLDQVDRHTVDPCRLEFCTCSGVGESGGTNDAVVPGQGQGQGARHLAGDPGDDDGGTVQGI